MTSTDITERLRRIIAEQLDVNISYAEIRDDLPLFEGGLGLDSVAVMEFITLIEEGFGFEFDEDELNLKPFANLLTLTDFVAGKLAAAAGTDRASSGAESHA
ncbi:MAG: acyl carrier protein [Methylococcus sp.]